jgi:hypothetical protein
MNWEGCEIQRSWTDLQYYPTFPGGTNENHENLGQDSGNCSRDSNQAPLQYKSEALQLVLIYSPTFGCGAHSASWQVGNGAPFPEGQSARGYTRLQGAFSEDHTSTLKLEEVSSREMLGNPYHTTWYHKAHEYICILKMAAVYSSETLVSTY